MIKILELLEETYPEHYKAEKLKNKVGLRSLDGEFSQILRYLKETGKIEIVFPESRIAPTGRYNLALWLMSIDEITITPEGIDFLTKLKLLESREKISQQQMRFTELLALATMILGITALFQLTKFEFPINSNNIFGLILLGFLSVVLLTLIVFLIIDSVRYIIKKYPFLKASGKI